MFVGVIHQIHDPERFRAAEAAAIEKGIPSALAKPIEFMTPDARTAISIWQGPSITAVRQLVESVVGGCSDTEYLELEARGLWDRAPAAVKPATSGERAEDGSGLGQRDGAEPSKVGPEPSGFALLGAWSQRTAK